MILTFDRRRYGDNILKFYTTEAEVQEAILGALTYLRVKAFPVDAGAKALRGRAVGALKRAGLSAEALKGRTGIQAGVSDVIGTLPGGRALYIEVKVPCRLDSSGHVATAAGRPTKEQVDFLEMMQAQGAVCGVCWSAVDAIDLVQKAMKEVRNA